MMWDSGKGSKSVPLLGRIPIFSVECLPQRTQRGIAATKGEDPIQPYHDKWDSFGD